MLSRCFVCKGAFLHAVRENDTKLEAFCQPLTLKDPVQTEMTEYVYVEYIGINTFLHLDLLGRILVEDVLSGKRCGDEVPFGRGVPPKTLGMKIKIFEALYFARVLHVHTSSTSRVLRGWSVHQSKLSRFLY